MSGETAMDVIAAPTRATRRRFDVQGVVQGVGFRPFVYRLAQDLALAGWVNNDGAGVTIEVEGDPSRIDEMKRRLTRDAPRLARIDRIAEHDCALRADSGFRDSGEPAQSRHHRDRPGQRDLRRLPGRALRSRRSSLSLRIHQLHPLRSALYDHALAAVRPGDDQHGPVPAVSRVHCRVSRSPASPFSRGAQRVPPVRSALGLVDTTGRAIGCADLSPRRSRDCAKAKSSRSRVSADFISPAMPATAKPWPGCGHARRARRSRLR